MKIDTILNFSEYRIWGEDKIERISEPWNLIVLKNNKWINIDLGNPNMDSNDIALKQLIYNWNYEKAGILSFVNHQFKIFDCETYNQVKIFNFPEKYIEDAYVIQLKFPLTFLSKIINRDDYDRIYKESIIFDLEKQEILSTRNFPIFSIFATNQKFLFCLSPDLKKLECFNIFEGQQEVWHYDFEAEGYEVINNIPPAQYADMLLFFVKYKEDAGTLAIDAQTGKKRWYADTVHLPDVSCIHKGNLVSYRGIWHNDVMYINPQTGDITEHWHLPDWLNDYPVDIRGKFTIDEQNLYLAPKNYVGLDHEYYEGKGVLVFSLETHELVQELPCQINMECKKIEKVGKRLFVHDHGNLHIFVEE